MRRGPQAARLPEPVRAPNDRSDLAMDGCDCVVAHLALRLQDSRPREDRRPRRDTGRGRQRTSAGSGRLSVTPLADRASRACAPIFYTARPSAGRIVPEPTDTERQRKRACDTAGSHATLNGMRVRACALTTDTHRHMPEEVNLGARPRTRRKPGRDRVPRCYVCSKSNTRKHTRNFAPWGIHMGTRRRLSHR